MDATVWTAASAGGFAVTLLGWLVALLGRRGARARARAAGLPVDRAPGRGRRHRREHRHGRPRERPGGRPQPPPGFVRYGTALLLGAGVAVSFGGAFGLVVGGLLAAACCRWLPDLPSVEQRRAAAQAAALRAQLPLTADLLAGCLVSWCAPATAAEAVAGAVGEPMAARLAEVAADLRMGGDAEESWARFGADPVLAPLGRCLVRASASGAPPAAGLARLAEGCRSSAATAAQGRARRAGVLATAPLGLCFLPAFVLIGVVPMVTGLAGGFLART